MLPPFLPFRSRPVRPATVKRSAPSALLRELIAIEVPSVKGERLSLKGSRLPPNARLRVLDR
jgi:hypothetical protein